MTQGTIHDHPGVRAAYMGRAEKLESELEWHRYHIGTAMHISTKSKDPSTRVGCVLVGPDNQVLSAGFNGFARGIRETKLVSVGGKAVKELDTTRWSRPVKYDYVVHAEVNAIFNAARHGVRLMGSVAYLNYAPCPCEKCADALIQVGVVKVVGPNIPFPGKGDGTNYTTELGLLKLKEAGIPWVTVPMEAK